MHVKVFAYGTLRTHPAMEELHGLDICNWDPNARKIGELGGWVLHDRRMFHEGTVPAVGDWYVHGARVIGDVYEVDMVAFRSLLQYEGYPRLYDFEVLTAVDRLDPETTCDVVVFTTSRAEEFGPPSYSGDYFTKEDRCEIQSRG